MKTIRVLLACAFVAPFAGCISQRPLPFANYPPAPKPTASAQTRTVGDLIVFGKYEGGILLDKENTWYLPESQLPTLNDGTHYLDVARIANSAFAFEVKDGRVVEPKDGKMHEAATVCGGKLHLKTVPVTIDPGAYDGVWRLATHFVLKDNGQYEPEWVTGKKTYALMPGLIYALDNGNAWGSVNGTSYLYFQVKGDGSVWNSPAGFKPSPFSSRAHRNVLELNVGRIQITPSDKKATYSVGRMSGLSDIKTVPVILGLRTSITTLGANTAAVDPYYGHNVGGTVTSGGVKYRWDVVP